MFNQLFAVSLACVIAPAFAGSSWETDLDSALKKAEGTSQNVLVEFTGSDWCGYCKILKKNVLDSDAFAEAAKDKFVLVELDFPRQKSMDPEQAKKNNVWKNKLKISGYPTIVLMDAQGKPYGNLIGSVKTTEDFMKIVNTWDKKKEQRDQLFAEAEKAEGLDKAKLLAKALSMMPDDYYHSFYTEALDNIKALDPKDEIGLQARLLRKDTLEKQSEALMGIFMKYRNQNMDQELAKLSPEEKQKAMKTEFLEVLEKPDTLPEIKQRILFQTEYTAAAMNRDINKMIEALNKVAAVDPLTEEGKHAASLVVQLKNPPKPEEMKNAIPATKMIVPGEEKKVIPAAKIQTP